MTPRWLDWRLHLVGLVATFALAVGGAHLDEAFLVVGGVPFLLLVGLAAERWPLRTLTAGALTTLLDPEVVPRLLPAGMGSGPIGLSEPVLAVAGAVVGVEALRTGRWRHAIRDPVTLLVGLFVALAVVSAAVNATPPSVALLGIVMTIDAIAIYFAVRAARGGERGAAIAVGAVVAGCLAVAAFGIVQVALHPEPLGFAAFRGSFGEGGRITAFLGNPNPAASVLSIGLPFALFGAVSLRRPRYRWLAAAAAYLLLLGLLLTFSRGAWLAVAAGGAVAALAIDWRVLPLLVLGVLLAMGTFTVMPRGLAAPGPGVLDDEVTGPPDLIDSTVDRLGNLRDPGDTRARFLREGIPILLDHPWLGVGPGRYGGAAATIIPSPVYDAYDTGLYGYRTVHNFWQHLLGESGALGTAVFLTLLATLVIRFARAARATVGRRRVILAGAATVILITGFHSVTEMIYEGNLPALLLWLVVGVASLLAPARPLFGADRSAVAPR